MSNFKKTLRIIALSIFGFIGFIMVLSIVIAAFSDDSPKVAPVYVDGTPESKPLTDEQKMQHKEFMEESKSVTEVKNRTWNDMNYNEKEIWIKSYLKKPSDNGYRLIDLTNTQLKNKFNVPSSVDFDNWGGAVFDGAYVVDADQGLVNKVVRGESKNSFGQKIRFTAQIQWVITPDELKLVKLDVRDGN